jgi:crotonobetainyl-CoA:carnitine CoA-transferase CaiB-like acyl-CoA transferase
MSRLLEGIRVLEVAVLLNGDRLGVLLGDMGADVVKVERPGVGDYIRDILGQMGPRLSPAHAQVNKNKRSVTIDVTKPEGRDLYLRLVDGADVVVDGLLPAAMDALGLGPDALLARKQSLVYCRYNGFGSTGPYAEVPTHGQMMDALAGSIPLKVEDGLVVRDSTRGPWTTETGGEGTATGAAYAAMHVAAGLVQAQRSGKGSYIDVSAADAVVTNAWTGVTYALQLDTLVSTRGMPDMSDQGNNSSRYQYYATSDDKFVLFCAIEPKFWARFCEVTGFASVVDGSTDPVDFGGGQLAERRALQDVFSTKTLADWMNIAASNKLPIGPAYQSVEELTEDPHLSTRELFNTTQLPGDIRFTYMGQPAVVAGQPYEVRYHAPELGQHTDEVLGEIGLSADEIAALRDEGVI